MVFQGQIGFDPSGDLRQVRPKICCFFDNLAFYYFTFTALRSTDKFSNEQQIFGLNSSFGGDVNKFSVKFSPVVGRRLIESAHTKRFKGMCGGKSVSAELERRA